MCSKVSEFKPHAFTFQAFACEADEDCLPIEECAEYKYVLCRQWEKIRNKICGIYVGTVRSDANFASRDKFLNVSARVLL